MSKRGWILRQGLINPSMELFKTAASDQGFELESLILQAHEDRPYAASYTIRVDERWRTRDVAIEIELEDGGQRSLALSADGAGNWTRGGQRLSELDDCVDADLEWSPSTNTLPIRRLALAPGETRAVAAAWIRFPPSRSSASISPMSGLTRASTGRRSRPAETYPSDIIHYRYQIKRSLR